MSQYRKTKAFSLVLDGTNESDLMLGISSTSFLCQLHSALADEHVPGRAAMPICGKLVPCGHAWDIGLRTIGYQSLLQQKPNISPTFLGPNYSPILEPYS